MQLQTDKLGPLRDNANGDQYSSAIVPLLSCVFFQTLEYPAVRGLGGLDSFFQQILYLPTAMKNTICLALVCSLAFAGEEVPDGCQAPRPATPNPRVRPPRLHRGDDRLSLQEQPSEVHRGTMKSHHVADGVAVGVSVSGGESSVSGKEKVEDEPLFSFPWTVDVEKRGLWEVIAFCPPTTVRPCPEAHVTDGSVEQRVLKDRESGCEKRGFNSSVFTDVFRSEWPAFDMYLLLFSKIKRSRCDR